MKKQNFITVKEFLENNLELKQGQTCYRFNSKTKAYWPLGTWKNGKVWSGIIQTELEPENTYIKV